MDEISLGAAPWSANLRDGECSARVQIHPEDFGIAMAASRNLRVEKAEESKTMLLDALSGRKSLAREIVAMKQVPRSTSPATWRRLPMAWRGARDLGRWRRARAPGTLHCITARSLHELQPSNTGSQTMSERSGFARCRTAVLRVIFSSLRREEHADDGYARRRAQVELVQQQPGFSAQSPRAVTTVRHTVAYSRPRTRSRTGAARRARGCASADAMSGIATSNCVAKVERAYGMQHREGEA